MMKKARSLLILIPVVLFTAGCSSLDLPAVFSTDSQEQQAQAVDQVDLSQQAVEDKLAIGILSLEGTGNAVTAEQAADLLPLWKAVRSLGSSTTASDDEITALYAQIQESMTADQVRAIEKLNLTQEEMRALMEKYDGAMGGDPQRMDPANMTDEQKATLEALRQGDSSGNAGGGRPGGGAGMPEGGGRMPPGGGEMPGGGMLPEGVGVLPEGGMMPDAQGTPSADQAMRRPRTGGLNYLLVEPVIQLLEERAGE